MSMNPALALSVVEASYDHTNDQGRELMRILLQEHLDKLSPSRCEQSVCGSDGIDRSERYSLELRRRMAENAAKSSFDETVETIEKTTGGHIPKRQVEELAQRAARDFDTLKNGFSIGCLKYLKAKPG